MSAAENELMVIEGIKAPVVFKMNGLDEFIEKVKAEVKLTAPDISTPKGRDEIRSKAFKIAKIKTSVDNLGKQAGEDARKMLEGVNAERKRAKEILEGLQEEVRKPLTDWENADKDRITKHENNITEINNSVTFITQNWQSLSIEVIQDRLGGIESARNFNWQEFSYRAEHAINEAVKAINEFIARRTTYDAEQAELARLRQEEADRKQREREEQIAKEAAEKARKDAEEKAERERLAEAARVKAEQDKAETERVRIEQERQQAEARVRKAEEDRIAAIAKAEQEKQEAAEKAEREKQEAIAKERQRVEDEKRREAEEVTKREADKAHRAKINNEILAGLIQTTGEDIGKKVIELIAKGQIPHIKIQY